MQSNKDSQIHIRLTSKEKEKVKKVANSYGYDNISKFIMDNLIYEKKIRKSGEAMVYTITLSPTLDYFINYDMTKVNINGANKFHRQDITFEAGGRGINTSKILNEFKVPNKSVYVAGGFTAEKIYGILDYQGIDQYKISNDEPTRVNINFVANDEVTTFEEYATRLSERVKSKLVTFVEEKLTPNDIVIFSGSHVAEDFDFVLKLLKNIKNITSNIYINSSTQEIQTIAEEIKPKFILADDNNCKKKIKSKKEIKEYMKKFIDAGVEEAAYYLDVNYTYYFTKDKSFISETKIDHLMSSIGLGDAFVGGIVSNLDKELKEKISWAAAAQKAKSLSQTETRFSRIVDLLEEVKIIED